MNDTEVGCFVHTGSGKITEKTLFDDDMVAGIIDVWQKQTFYWLINLKSTNEQPTNEVSQMRNTWQ